MKYLFIALHTIFMFIIYHTNKPINMSKHNNKDNNKSKQKCMECGSYDINEDEYEYHCKHLHFCSEECHWENMSYSNPRYLDDICIYCCLSNKRFGGRIVDDWIYNTMMIHKISLLSVNDGKGIKNNFKQMGYDILNVKSDHEALNTIYNYGHNVGKQLKELDKLKKEKRNYIHSMLNKFLPSSISELCLSYYSV